MRPSAVEAMLPYLTEQFANPSGSHQLARKARRAVDDARGAVAGVIGCGACDVVFTGGGTEGDNAVLTGAVMRRPGRPVCSVAEHHAVLHVVERHRGVMVAVDELAHIDVDALGEHVDDTTPVVSVMAVNNEVGTVTDMAVVSALVRERAPQAVLHTDAVQASGWLDLPSLWSSVDALTISAHKFGGPKGVGVMALRRGAAVTPFIIGGGQERDRRSGTHNVAGIVAASTALVEADRMRTTDAARIGALRDRLVTGLRAVDGVHETVPAAAKVPGAAHVLVEGVESEALLYMLDEEGVCASAASACASGAMEPSHVLGAMGVPGHLSSGALRLTLGHSTTDADIDQAIEVITRVVTTLRTRTRAHASAP
ncbi:cysteine desulfurase family protein [soil metagenome]